MKALLLVAHGSRRDASNEEVRQLTQCLKLRTDENEFIDVRCAFLELADPSIPDGVQQCIESGAQEVLVLPYFLSAGRHVAQDIPQLLAESQEANPQVNIVDREK